MKNLPRLYPVISSRVAPPICIALGPPWPVTQLVGKLRADHRDARIDCFQMDLFAADRLRDKLAQENLTANVVTGADLWELPAVYRTVIFPAAAQADRELKLDIVDQSYHILVEGGKLLALSEYEKDVLFAKWMKRAFGKCGESPSSERGMAFWSERGGEKPRRRHAITFHAKIGDRASVAIECWPGTFSYGEMDNGSRAMLEVAQLQPCERILDMGCGNGSVGILAATLAEGSHITFIDSSARACELTRRNISANNTPNATVVADPDLGGLEPGTYDVVLANPPYYANSEVARLFIATARDLLAPGGRFHLVTKMPVQTIPEVVETFGDVESIDNRGYTVLTARV